MNGKVLIHLQDRLSFSFLEEGGPDYVLTPTASEALLALEKGEFSLVFSDSLALLQKVKERAAEVSLVLLGESGSLLEAKEAIRLGVFDYLVKPVTLEMIEETVARREEEKSRQREISYHSCYSSYHIMAESLGMQKILSGIDKIAQSSASVFITGESGTGKEVFAHTLHFRSKRAGEPFIKVNCAAIPESLIESEFFGHEKGAFTGATQERRGRFELASKGTLLLDEVTEIPLSLQAKLLRAVQEQEFERVGGSKPIRVNVRFIATSNRPMKEAIEARLFREDLYYRLNVIPIHLPPLRERKEDILLLAEDFLKRFCLENHKRMKRFSSEAKDRLLEYPWPGNIRELANVIERTVVIDLDEVIDVSHLQLELSCPLVPSYKPVSLSQLEKSHILETLKACAQNRSEAARKLGISVRTLRNKLALYTAESR